MLYKILNSNSIRLVIKHTFLKINQKACRKKDPLDKDLSNGFGFAVVRQCQLAAVVAEVHLLNLLFLICFLLYTYNTNLNARSLFLLVSLFSTYFAPSPILVSHVPNSRPERIKHTTNEHGAGLVWNAFGRELMRDVVFVGGMLQSYRGRHFPRFYFNSFSFSQNECTYITLIQKCTLDFVFVFFFGECYSLVQFYDESLGGDSAVCVWLFVLVISSFRRRTN